MLVAPCCGSSRGDNTLFFYTHETQVKECCRLADIQSLQRILVYVNRVYLIYIFITGYWGVLKCFEAVPPYGK